MSEAKIQKYSYRTVLTFMTIFICLFLVSFSIAPAFLENYGGKAERLEMLLDRNYKDASNLIRPDEVRQMEEEDPDCDIAYMNYKASSVAARGMNYSATAVLTSWKYPQLFKMDMIRGAFFTEASAQKGRNTAVISNTLAEKLFTTYDVVGNEITLLGQKYSIVGVYKNNNSLISFLNSDGVEKVFIPFESVLDPKKDPVEDLVVQGGVLAGEKFRQYQLENNLRENYYINTGFYKTTDYYEASVLIDQFSRILLLLIGVGLIFELLKQYRKSVANYTGNLKQSFGSEYLGDMLKRPRLAYFQIVPVTLALAVFIVGILFIVRFSFYIPNSLLPQNNIFDFGFYWDKIKEAIYSSNGMTGFAASQLSVEYSTALKLSGVLALLSAIGLLLVLWGLRLFRELNKGWKSKLTVLLIAASAAIVIYTIISFAIGVNWHIPGKELLLTMVFLTVKTYSN